jgi:hypothetical protein
MKCVAATGIALFLEISYDRSVTTKNRAVSIFMELPVAFAVAIASLNFISAESE